MKVFIFTFRVDNNVILVGGMQVDSDNLVSSTALNKLIIEDTWEVGIRGIRGYVGQLLGWWELLLLTHLQKLPKIFLFWVFTSFTNKFALISPNIQTTFFST